MSDENSTLVYSTDRPVDRKSGRTDRRNKRNNDAPQRPENKSAQKVRVRRDRKGRGGKSVTVIEGLQMSQKEMTALLKQLKAGLGTGGAVKGACLEIQGDRCEPAMQILEKMGYRPKRSGG